MGRQYFEVIEIFVQPNYRRKGIATQTNNTLKNITGKPRRWKPNSIPSEEMKTLTNKLNGDKKIIKIDDNTFLVF